MCEVLSIVNQKGEPAGKSAVTANLGIGLARKGKKVALIDADAQGSLTTSLCFGEPDQLAVSLSSIMTDLINEKEIDPLEGILHHQEGVDLIPANIELSGLEVTLSNVMSREMVLRDYLEMLRPNYDYILIDCMPSLGMITINSLAAADSVIIPVQTAYLPVKGLEQLLRTIGMVRRRLNRRLGIKGILITMADFRTNCARDIKAKMQETYGKSVGMFSTSIPASVKIVEASAEGISIYAHDPSGKAALAFEHFTEEVLAG